MEKFISGLIIYFVVINLIGLAMMYIDKRYAIKGKFRISEKNLIGTCFMGGGFGILAGMYMFRHKTKHLKFTLGVPIIIASEIALIIYFVIKW